MPPVFSGLSQREKCIALRRHCQRPAHTIYGLVGITRDGLAVQLRPVSEQPVVAGIVERLKPGEDKILRHIRANNAQLLSTFHNTQQPGFDLPSKGGKWVALQSRGRQVLPSSDRSEEPGLLE